MLVIARRFWPIVTIIAAATGALLYLAITYSSGLSKVWASVVTIAGAVGVIAASLRAVANRVWRASASAAEGVRHDVSVVERVDARAWTITWLPALPQTRVQQYRLANRVLAHAQAGRGLATPTEQTQ